MKHRIKKINYSRLRFALTCLLGVGTAIYLSSVTIAAPTQAPQSVVPCFPKDPPSVSSAKVSNVVKEKQITYYLMSSNQTESGTDLLIAVNDNNNSCKLLLFNPMGDTLPLSRFVPMSVAQQFALQQVKQGLSEAGSRQAYQQQLMQVEVWTPEELWAVQRLGFKTPKNIKVIAPEDIKVSPEQDELQ